MQVYSRLRRNVKQYALILLSILPIPDVVKTCTSLLTCVTSQRPLTLYRCDQTVVYRFNDLINDIINVLITFNVLSLSDDETDRFDCSLLFPATRLHSKVGLRRDSF